MPSKYVVRTFEENAAFHVFHRGIEKRKVFVDKQDYDRFLKYVSIYLSPLDVILIKYPYLEIRLQAKNLSKEIDLIAFCLMPNHFHFLIFQKSRDGISKFMKQLLNGYTKYFNRKYDRAGNLFEGRFKAVSVKDDELMLHISRYIHLNPLVAGLTEDVYGFPWSSLQYYTNKTRVQSIDFLSTDLVLSKFKKEKDYRNFIDNQKDYAKELSRVKNLTID
ncbi:transposase [Candidatus Curtissbacteria bacterium]|nr:transposase [Candidatus Curtissbacteria bacterium]